MAVNIIKKPEQPKDPGYCVIRFTPDLNSGKRMGVVVAHGTKYVKVAWIYDSGVRVTQHAIQEISAHAQHINTYDPRKAARQMLKAGKVLSISKAARQALQQVAKKQGA